MIKHYIKIAWRNLLKYRTQSVVSIAGLAIGFTCFSFCLLWLRYEMTFDSFHDSAERIYHVHIEEGFGGKKTPDTPHPLAAYLKSTFPEIELACNINTSKATFSYNNHSLGGRILYVDSSSIHFFNIQLLEGNLNFMMQESEEVAITDQLAHYLFPNKDPLGEKIQFYNNDFTICAIVKGWNKHSNLNFQVLRSNDTSNSWRGYSWYTFIKLSTQINPYDFADKLYKHEIAAEEDPNRKISNLILTPITSMRHHNLSEDPKITLKHLLFFMIGSGLVVLCALFNYINLFINRLYIRNREMGIRKVVGASDTRLIQLISVEFLLIFFLALVLGMILIELTLAGFIQLSEIKTDKNLILLHSFYFTGSLTGLSFIISLLLVYSYRKRSIRSMIQKETNEKNRFLFQKTLLVFQFIICTVFIFCTFIMNSQLHHLHHTQEIIERKNQGIISYREDFAPLLKLLDESPYVIDYLSPNHSPFFPSHMWRSQTFLDWEDKPLNSNPVTMELISGAASFCNFYNLQLIEGEILQEDDPEEWIMINEKAVQELGLSDPIGKRIFPGQGEPKVIKGILKDFCKTAPTVPVTSIMLVVPGYSSTSQISFKYKEGHWKDIYRQLNEWRSKHSVPQDFSISNVEEEFDKLLVSEISLIKLMDFIAVICILISLFGIYSLVMLDCKRNRKSIAIRKINGAQISTILWIYLRKYLLLLTIATAIAFPTGYIIMQRWIENYITRISITPWVYIGIWTGLALLIIACISGSILKTIRINPAEVIKSE